jgi:hypothetical protein
MHATHGTRPRFLAADGMDVMRPSQLLGAPAPSADDPRRWLRAVFQVLVVLVNVAGVAVLLGVALR